MPSKILEIHTCRDCPRANLNNKPTCGAQTYFMGIAMGPRGKDTTPYLDTEPPDWCHLPNKKES